MRSRSKVRATAAAVAAAAVAAVAASAGLSLTVPSCAALSYIGYRLSPDYPRDRTETLYQRGLGQAVRIYFDPAGIPHIEAENEKDMLFGAGFVHGRNRFFQMDLSRRLARGRLSELIGEQRMGSSTSVVLDAAMRGWGMDAAAVRDVGELSPKMLELIRAYVAGVNAALKRYPPLEYRLLRVKPEKWTAADSFAVGRLTAWTIADNWSQELSRLLLAVHLGVDRADAIYPSTPWRGFASIELGASPQPLPEAIVDEVRPLFPARSYGVASTRRPGGDAGVARGSGEPGAELVSARFSRASNAWVVGGRFTESGKPMLASDPHLSHRLPSLMFQQHMSCPGFDVIGITTPGLPYLVIGHTPYVAWGLTASAADSVDLYLEKTHPSDRNRVLTPSGYKPIERRRAVIRVRKGGRLVKKVVFHRHTENGPVVNDIYPGLLPSWAPVVSVRWDAADLAGTLERLRKGNMAESVEDLRRALEGTTVPAGAVTAADVTGKIGLFATGRLPMRTRHRGTFPVPGWLGKYRVPRHVPAFMMPSVTAGPDSLLAHSNNLVWRPERAPFLFQIDSAPSHRVDRVLELLRSRPKHDVESFARIQSDDFLMRAKRIVPLILDDLAGAGRFSSLQARAMVILSRWDFRGRADSTAASIFFVTYRKAALLALSDELPPRARRFVAGHNYSGRMIDGWFFRPDSVVWDNRATRLRETRAHVVRAAFRGAVQELSQKFGADPSRWRWGRLHFVQVQHPFGKKRALASLVNLPKTETPGGLDSVYKTHFHIENPKTPFRTVAGPVFRMIVDLKDPARAWWVLDTGSSGWPGSPHYGDQFERWKKGEYVPMLADWSEIKKAAGGVLTLKPL